MLFHRHTVYVNMQTFTYNLKCKTYIIFYNMFILFVLNIFHCYIFFMHLQHNIFMFVAFTIVKVRLTHY